MKLRKGDFAVIAVIIIASISLWVYPIISAKSDTAVVTQNGKVKYRLDLKKDRTVTVNGATITVSDRTVRVSLADCRDQVCVNTGRISKPGQSIVCVPNKIVVKIAQSKESETDVIVS